MLNTANPSGSSGVDLSARSDFELRRIQSQTIGEMMQCFDSLDDIGEIVRDRDIVNFSCLSNAIREKKKFLQAVNAELDVREHEVTIFDSTRPLNFCL